MKPAPFDYARPASIAEACRLIDEAGGGATLIAGGQTLMPLLNLRLAQPFVVVDLGAIAELRGVTRGDGFTRIGAMTTQAEVLADPLVQANLPALARAVAHVGHHQTRNRGTLGGSIAFAESAAECPATALALGARMVLQSVRGQRVVEADGFFLGPYQTVLEQDEMLLAVEFPDWPDGHIPLFREVARRPGDFALTGLVGALAVEGGVIVRAGIAWLAMGPTPVRARAVEAALAGAAIATLDPARLADLALSECAPFDDKAASAAYRLTVGRRLFAQVLREALGARLAA